jgi:hypothetical protein
MKTAEALCETFAILSSSGLIFFRIEWKTLGASQETRRDPVVSGHIGYDLYYPNFLVLRCIVDRFVAA